MSIMLSTPLVIGPGSVTAEMMDSGVAAAGHVLTADGAGGADYAAPAGGGPGYLEYVALLTQIDTNAPVATVLKNTLGGTVVWTRATPGQYFATLSGAFLANKTIVLTNSAIAGNIHIVRAGRNDNNTVLLGSYAVIDAGDADYLLENTPIEIRVYP